ncbi:hypothetical protein AOB60_01465 [Streptomyces noursei]|uniref:Uncharacterized protein n=1 Tax=Streptomyces noursei TaxID=1971 RepID=A0A2N8PFP3_STRNR|nr:hypothetical protein AOB60_01465 [Streptomyces noursei]
MDVRDSSQTSDDQAEQHHPQIGRILADTLVDQWRQFILCCGQTHTSLFVYNAVTVDVPVG